MAEKQTFREWLYSQLVAEEEIAPDDVDCDDFELEDLYMCTDIDEEDIENYRTQYKEVCSDCGYEPDFDI